jgi:hypothetical protein
LNHQPLLSGLYKTRELTSRVSRAGADGAPFGPARPIFSTSRGTRKVFRMRFVFGLVRAFVCTINRSYRVNIGLGSSHRVFLVRALTGPARPIFSNKLGHKAIFRMRVVFAFVRAFM